MSNTKSSKNTKYLTKRVLERATSNAFNKASKNAMTVAGSVVIVKNGWVVRIFENGDEKRIEPLKKSRNQTLALD